MVCNYLSNWWEKGPENSDPDALTCTRVTSDHLSIILGNILKILNHNLGMDDASWMKRLAGQAGRTAAGKSSLLFPEMSSVECLHCVLFVVCRFG